MKRIKLLQLVGKESRRGLFLRRIKEKDQTIEREEDQIIGKTEDQILNLQGSNVLVVRDMVT